MSIVLLISLLATVVSAGRVCFSGPECVYRREYVSGPECVYRSEYFSGPEFASGPEYVYGPEYVDEFVALLDEEREPVFILQDGNYNVVAAVSAEGEVVEDLAYTPYGRPVSHRYQGTLASGAPLLLGIGHQGLFFDRFDLTPGQPPLELGVGVRGVYSNASSSGRDRAGFGSRCPAESPACRGGQSASLRSLPHWPCPNARPRNAAREIATLTREGNCRAGGYDAAKRREWL